MSKRALRRAGWSITVVAVAATAMFTGPAVALADDESTTTVSVTGTAEPTSSPATATSENTSPSSLESSSVTVTSTNEARAQDSGPAVVEKNASVASPATTKPAVWTVPDDGIAAGGRKYSVNGDGVTVYYPAGQSAQPGDHINVTIRDPETGTTMQLGAHVEGNNQWTQPYIGQSPWVANLRDNPQYPGWDCYEIIWVQVHGQNYHFGEAGKEAPIGSTCGPVETTTPETTTPETSSTTTETTTSETTTETASTETTSTTTTTLLTAPTTPVVETTTITTDPPAETTDPLIETTTPTNPNIPVVDIPKVEFDSPAVPTSGPSGEPVRMVTTPDGYRVWGYDNEKMMFVPLAYDDALVFETGGTSDHGGGPAASLAVGIGGAGMVAGAGIWAVRRRFHRG